MKHRYSKKKGARSGEWRICAAESCEQKFYNYPSWDQRFCSRPCAYRSRPSQPQEANERRKVTMLRANRAGSRNPNFRHGKRAGDNIRGWSPRHKGEEICRVCGSAEWVQLHHAIPRSKYRAGRRELLNGLPLCASCHMRWHRRSLTIYRDVFTSEEWAWLSSVTLTGENTDAWLDKNYPEKLAA